MDQFDRSMGAFFAQPEYSVGRRAIIPCHLLAVILHSAQAGRGLSP